MVDICHHEIKKMVDIFVDLSLSHQNHIISHKIESTNNQSSSSEQSRSRILGFL